MLILVDMNLAPRWANYLQASGFPAIHWSATGAPNAPDSEIMAWARANGRVVFTHDLDFGAILAATNNNRPSVLQVRTDDTSPEAIGSVVIDALKQFTDDLDAGALVTVEPGRSRVRLLPLNR